MLGEVDGQLSTPNEPHPLTSASDHNKSPEALVQTSTPARCEDDVDESSNDSTTLQIVLPSSERKRKAKNVDINKEIEDHIQKELAKKPRKTSLTVKNVKSILKYVIGNEKILAMVSSSMKDAGQDLEVEPKLTRSKAKKLREENQIMWPLSPIPQPNPVDNEHLVLIREELPEEEDDDEYRPTVADLLEHSDDESGRQSTGTPSLNASSASRYLANFNPDLLEDDTEKTILPVDIPDINDELIIDFKKPAENIGQRTRSKFSLSSTPLETIELAFVPPDITTDMYDSYCDNQDWGDFLKTFMLPLPNDTADVDEEDDPEYNIVEDEELDKEELRRDNAVTVPRSELKTLVMELLGGNEELSSDDDTAKPMSVAPSPAVNTKEPKPVGPNEILTCPVSPPLPPVPPEEPVIGLTFSQRLLLLQQMRQHVQLVTQHFLQTHKHPLFHNFSSKCKEMLVQLVKLGSMNPDSAVNVFNLHKAVSLSDYWQNLLLSSRGSEIIKFLENELSAAQNAKKRKLLYRLTFHPHLIDLIMQSDVFLYPSLLPTQPFRSDLPLKLEFTDAEDYLIAIGLEQFIPYVKKYPQWYDGRQQTERASADYIHELMLPAKSTLQIIRRIRSMKRVNGNPIWNYFQHGRVNQVSHQVIQFDFPNILPPKELKPSLLHSCWRQFVKDLKMKK